MKHLPEVDAVDVPGPFVVVKFDTPQRVEIEPNSNENTNGGRTDLLCLKPTGEVHVVSRIPPGYRCPCGTPLAEVRVPLGTATITRDFIFPVQEAP